MEADLFLNKTEEVLKCATGKGSLPKTIKYRTGHIIDFEGEGGGLPVKEKPLLDSYSSWTDYSLEQMSSQPQAPVKVKLRIKKK